MTKYTFLVQHTDTGNHTVITRLADGALKYFYQAGADKTVGITKFFNSMTDELLDGYFPKPGKRGNGDVDNWVYLESFMGPNIGRMAVEANARTIFIGNP